MGFRVTSTAEGPPQKVELIVKINSHLFPIVLLFFLNSDSRFTRFTKPCAVAVAKSGAVQDKQAKEGVKLVIPDYPYAGSFGAP